MKIERLLVDVNLSEVDFDAVSSKVTLRFLNMSDGNVIASLECIGLVFFAYHALPASGVPQYVGEVNHIVILKDEVPGLLKRLSYGFSKPQDGPMFPNVETVHHVHVEGNVLIEIICTELVKKTGSD